MRPNYFMFMGYLKTGGGGGGGVRAKPLKPSGFVTASYFFLLYISESKYLHSICIEYNIMNYRVIIVYIHGYGVVNMFRDA